MKVGEGTQEVYDDFASEESEPNTGLAFGDPEPSATAHLPTQTITGHAVVIYRLLAEFQLWRLAGDQEAWNQVLSGTPAAADLEKVLQTILDLQGTDAPLAKDFDKLLIFKNTKWLKARLKAGSVRRSPKPTEQTRSQ